jgi:hypothetical protein
MCRPVLRPACFAFSPKCRYRRQMRYPAVSGWTIPKPPNGLAAGEPVGRETASGWIAIMGNDDLARRRDRVTHVLLGVCRHTVSGAGLNEAALASQMLRFDFGIVQDLCHDRSDRRVSLRQDRQCKVMTLGVAEFIRRFLLHTLPDGLHRIPHYGFLANGERSANIALSRRLLDNCKASTGSARSAEPGKDEPALSCCAKCPECGGAPQPSQSHPAIPSRSTATPHDSRLNLRRDQCCSCGDAAYAAAVPTFHPHRQIARSSHKPQPTPTVLCSVRTSPISHQTVIAALHCNDTRDTIPIVPTFPQLPSIRLL